MAISRIGAGNTNSFSGTTILANDIIAIVAFNSTSTTPSTPSGYTLIANGSQSAANFAMTWVYKVAAGGDTFPSITNSTQYVWAVYRGCAISSSFVQVSGQASSSSSTTISYSGITTFQNAGKDWVLTCGVSNNQNAAIGSVPPTSMTLPTSGEAKSAGFDLATFDSNGVLSSYSFNSKTLSQSSSWITKTAELVALATPTNLFFY